MIRQLKIKFYAWWRRRCIKNYYADYDDNHFDGADRWSIRAENATKTLREMGVDVLGNKP